MKSYTQQLKHYSGSFFLNSILGPRHLHFGNVMLLAHNFNVGKLIKTILILSALSLLNTGCYNSLGFKSNPAAVIDSEIHMYHPEDNRNYKVVLSNGKTKKYCCIASKNNDVVFFNKLIVDKEKGHHYEPHGYPVSEIKNIKYWNGTTFGSIFGEIMLGLFMEAVDIGIDAALYGNNNDNDSNGRSESKTHKGKRDNAGRSGNKSENKKRSRTN